MVRVAFLAILVTACGCQRAPYEGPYADFPGYTAARPAPDPPRPPGAAYGGSGDAMISSGLSMMGGGYRQPYRAPVTTTCTPLGGFLSCNSY